MKKQDHGFVARLNEMADDLGIAPGRGRATQFGRLFGAKQQTADLWFQGRTKPRLATIKRIVAKTRVRTDWLLHGVGEKHLDAPAMRPALAALVRAAEPLPDYVLDELKRIGPALVKPANDQNGNGEDGNGEAPPTRKKAV